MREICTSGSVGGEGGNILAYPALSAEGACPPWPVKQINQRYPNKSERARALTPSNSKTFGARLY